MTLFDCIVIAFPSDRKERKVEVCLNHASVGTNPRGRSKSSELDF